MEHPLGWIPFWARNQASGTFRTLTDLHSLTDVDIKREMGKKLTELRQDMNRSAESLRKELEHMRRSQEKLENSLAETQTERKAIKTRRNNADEGIGEVEDRTMELTQTGQQTENQIEKHESHLRELWDNIKRAKICKTETPQGEAKEEGLKIYLKELHLETFPI